MHTYMHASLYASDTVECSIDVRTSIPEPQLSAGYISINVVPEIITHSAPSAIAADFNTTLEVVGAILQSDVSIATACMK